LFATTAVLRISPPIIALEEAPGFAVPLKGHLMRQALWNAQIKEMLLDELNSMKFTEIFEE
jgi:hypothetical protein